MRILIFIITIIASIGMIFCQESENKYANAIDQASCEALNGEWLEERDAGCKPPKETNEGETDWKMYVNVIAKWLHIIAGITWIGLLYFFNFVNGHFAGTLDPDSKKKVVPELMPRALYWFRWGAAWTWLTGITLLFVIFYLTDIMPQGFTSYVPDDSWDEEPANMWMHISLTLTFVSVFIYDFLYKSTIGKNTRAATLISFGLIAGFIYLMSCYANFDYRLYNIHIGAMFGTMMAFNVWFRIWPAQQRIITAIKEGAAPNASDVGLAGLRSKHNTYMSVPLIWTMISEHHSAGVFSGDSVELFGYSISGEVWLLFFIALGWHIVFQLYRKSGKVKGF